jgi:hypothetical protein
MVQEGRSSKVEEAYVTASKSVVGADAAVAPYVRVTSP